MNAVENEMPEVAGTTSDDAPTMNAKPIGPITLPNPPKPYAAPIPVALSAVGQTSAEYGPTTANPPFPEQEGERQHSDESDQDRSQRIAEQSRGQQHCRCAERGDQSRGAPSHLFG